MELWWDGSTPTARLDQRDGRNGFTRFVNARAEGKLGEVAFSRFLSQTYNIESQVDWDIYGEYETTDHGDIKYICGDDGGEYPPAVEFDVKKTKPWNQWLAIRESIFESHPDGAPFILTKLSLEDDLDVQEFEDTDAWDAVTVDSFEQKFDEYVAREFPLSVELVGSAYPDEFTDRFEQGDRLYDPDSGRKLGGGLRMDNVGIHVSDLVSTPQRWDRIVSDIVGDNPISWSPMI
jgi:hypothetical protein